MGCGGSASRDPPLPDFPLKDEAVRVFKLADLNSDGKLDLDELKNTMKKPQFAETAMENLDLDGNGVRSAHRPARQPCRRHAPPALIPPACAAQPSSSSASLSGSSRSRRRTIRARRRPGRR